MTGMETVYGTPENMKINGNRKKCIITIRC